MKHVGCPKKQSCDKALLFSASVSCWWWCHQCNLSATITGSQQWVTSEYPLILQRSVWNSAPFISVRQKSFCHTNGRVNDIVSCFMLPRYQLNISCMRLTTFVRRRREAFIGKNNASRPRWCSIETITPSTKQAGMEDKKGWWVGTAFEALN